MVDYSYKESLSKTLLLLSSKYALLILSTYKIKEKRYLIRKGGGLFQFVIFKLLSYHFGNNRIWRKRLVSKSSSVASNQLI